VATAAHTGRLDTVYRPPTLADNLARFATTLLASPSSSLTLATALQHHHQQQQLTDMWRYIVQSAGMQRLSSPPQLVTTTTLPPSDRIILLCPRGQRGADTQQIVAVLVRYPITWLTSAALQPVLTPTDAGTTSVILLRVVRRPGDQL